MKQILLIACGAAAGGALGFCGFFWILPQGFYALILPGGLLGLGAALGRTRFTLVAVICGLAAVALGLFTEWRYAPFIQDDGLKYFLTHIHELRPITLIMILVGGLIGFWVPFSRTREIPVRGAVRNERR